MRHRVGINGTGRGRGDGVEVERLDGAAVRAWAQAAASALQAARASIDSLNVFPVADADTGTNLYLTVAQGAGEVGALPAQAGAADAIGAFAYGALVGARGNSGVIVSQFLLGLAGGLPEQDLVGPQGLARALDQAQRAAWAAVARPVKGTILTAATAAAQAAGVAGDGGGDLAAVTGAALDGARAALARTPDELAVLRAAGVVDAGATGLVVILEALVAVVTGRPAPGAVPIAARVRPGAGDPAGAYWPGPAGEFEVMFLVESDAPGIAGELSRRLQSLGESVAVVGGPAVWHAHVHTADPAAAVAAGALGTQRQITVRHLRAPTVGAHRLGLVVGTRAPALIRELARSGAIVMVLTGAAASAANVLRAVVDTGAAQVAVLPGSPGARAAARAAALAHPGITVHVLEADDDAHVVAGLAAAVASRSLRTATGRAAGAVAREVAAIRGAVAAVRTCEVEAGDAVVVRQAADDLLAAGGDVLTVLRGARASDDALASLLEHVSRTYPGLEVVVLAGGQVTSAFALAVE